MSSIFFDPAQFGAPSEQEPREQLIVNGRYVLPPIGDPTGKRRSLQRVTNFIKQLSETGGLERWKLRMAVIGLARDERRYDLACSINPDSARGKQDLDQLIEECIDLGQAGPSGGNITGTALHNLTDDVAGSYPVRVRDKWVPKLENYQRALHEKGLRVVPGLQERLVVSERYGTCGRLDDVYEDPFGTLRVGDRKSQKEFYTWWEIGAQLALYQCSEAMWNEETSSWEEMPALADDYAHVAWMPLKHPNGGKPRGSVDDVTIYDLPLQGARRILDWCAEVRALRTGARRWGQERPDLDDFAQVARDIRDAESHDDLRKLMPAINQGVGSHMLMEMAAKRWEELAAVPAPEPVVTPLNDTVRVSMTSNYNFGAAEETILTISGTQESIADLAAAAFGSGVTQQLGTDPATRALQYAAADLVAPLAEVQLTPQRLNTQGRADAAAFGFDPSLFGAPSQDATFPADGGAGTAVSARGGIDLAGPALTQSALAADREAFDHLGEDVVNSIRLITLLADARTPGERDKAVAEVTRRDLWGAVQLRETGADGRTVSGWLASRGLQDIDHLITYEEPRPELGMSAGWVDGEGVLRKPTEWMHYLQLTESSIKADPDGAWCKPMSLKVFQSLYDRGGFGIVPTEGQAHPVGTAKFTHSKHEGATVVELPELPTSADDRDTAIEALDSVPIKIVREVCTRANNSKSSRGRVRLLNDVEEKKYAPYGVELMPALLKEWLIIDGLAGEPGFNKDGIPRVANTGGSSREPMDARDAGRISLSQYLAEKDGASAGTETDADDVRLKDSVDISKAITLNVAEKIQEFADTVAEIRKPYTGLSEGPQAGKHSILRLIELAKDARNGAERAKVFHEITRRKAWTGEIAAEINQHYLDNGYAVENFDPYFEAIALPTGTATTVIAAGAPLPPLSDVLNGEVSPGQAVAQLQACTRLTELHSAWERLTRLPCWEDATVQEAAFAMLAKIKS